MIPFPRAGRLTGAPGTSSEGSTVVVQPQREGPFKHELWMPDYPDDPTRTLKGIARNNLSGAPIQEDAFPNYVQSRNGGIVDADHGLAFADISGDYQFVYPDIDASQPLKIKMIPLRLPKGKILEKIQIKFKVNSTPANSYRDDPTVVPELIPGVLIAKGYPTSDTIVMDNLKPVPQVLSVLYHGGHDEAVVEITAKVTIVDINVPSLGTTSSPPAPVDTTLLARAFYPSCRLSLVKKVQGTTTGAGSSSPDFVPIDGEGLIPSPVIDANCKPLPPDPAHQFYIEFTIQDLGAKKYSTLAVYPPSSGLLTNQPPKITLYPVGKPSGRPDGSYIVYRSGPIQCYLEDPSAFGLGSFPFPTPKGQKDTNYVSVASPYLQQFIDIANNGVRIQTPLRPVTFLNLGTPDGSIEPNQPKPRIDFQKLRNDDEVYSARFYPIEVDLTAKKVYLNVDGVVRDVVADFTNRAGSLKSSLEEVTVNGAPVQVAGYDEPNPGPIRPFAWYGTFGTRVELRPGFNVIEVTATNLLGGKTSRLIFADLFDTRNDYANPDPSTMTVWIRLAADPRRYYGIRGNSFRGSIAQPTGS